MTAPDPTLAARLIQLRLSRMNGAAANGAFIKALATAFEDRQLITLADAEAMVRAENEACAMAVQSRSDFYAEQRKTAHDCEREMLMGDIIMAHDYAMDDIRARVKLHNNDVA